MPGIRFLDIKEMGAQTCEVDDTGRIFSQDQPVPWEGEDLDQIIKQKSRNFEPRHGEKMARVEFVAGSTLAIENRFHRADSQADITRPEPAPWETKDLCHVVTHMSRKNNPCRENFLFI
jgi:hypothetical protein